MPHSSLDPRSSPLRKAAPSPQDQGKITQVVISSTSSSTVLNAATSCARPRKGDFKIWDDKAPQAIRYFSRKPICRCASAALDTSNSIRDRLKFRAGRRHLILFSVIAQQGQAFVMTFDDEPPSCKGSPMMLGASAMRSSRRAPEAAPRSMTDLQRLPKGIKPSAAPARRPAGRRPPRHDSHQRWRRQSFQSHRSEAIEMASVIACHYR